MSGLRLVHATSGVLFVHKPAGLGFHSSGEQPGIMPQLREMQRTGSIPHAGRLYACHRLDAVTSGLIMVARSSEAAAELGRLLRERRVHKYYVALSAKKPKKKQGRVRGDLVRSRRGQWMLTRELTNPSLTHFVSGSIHTQAVAGRDLTAFLMKPATGRTHQLRVVLKSLSAPLLGDPRYAAATATSEERAYLHAAAIRLPRGLRALADEGESLDVVSPPDHGSAFLSEGFCQWWGALFDDKAGGVENSSDGDRGQGQGPAVWFEGTPVQSAPPTAKISRPAVTASGAPA